MPSIVRMYCPCCGVLTRGRQFSEQPAGYGICEKCADDVSAKLSAEEMRRLYGIARYHYRIRDARRASKSFQEYHRNPEWNYYLFLRAVYGMEAMAAWKEVKRWMRTQIPARRLRCCVCAGEAYGRQWHNRDTGYGVCEPCVDFVGERESPEEIRSLYGIKGYHYAVPRAPE